MKKAKEKVEFAIGDCFEVVGERCNYQGHYIKVSQIMEGVNCVKGTVAQWADPAYESYGSGPYGINDLKPISKIAWTKARTKAVEYREYQESFFISPDATEEEIETAQALRKEQKKGKKASKTPTKKTKKATKAKGTSKKASSESSETIPKTRKPRGLALVKAREKASTEPKKSGSSQNALDEAIQSMTVAQQRKKPVGRKRKTSTSENNLENFI